MISRRFIVVTGSLLFLAAGVVLACADFYDPFDSGYSFFQSNITAQPQYAPFNFTESYTLDFHPYGDETDDTDLPDGNITEWYNLCKGTVERNDIDSFLNTFDHDDVRSLAQLVIDLPAKVRNNSFSHFLLLPQNKDLLDYMVYAKQCEPLNAEPGGHWDDAGRKYVDNVKDTIAMQQMIARGAAQSHKAKSEFLKWRYAFQALRLAFYNRDNQQVLDLYGGLVGKRTADNIMYPRCLGLKAGALFRTGHKKEAAYFYSQAFDLSNDMKFGGYLSFLWCTDSLAVSDIFPLCKSKHEKAVLWVMDGLNERSGEEFEGVDCLRSAYELDPNVRGLKYVMTREMNKAERRYLQRRESEERTLNSRTGYLGYISQSDGDSKKWQKEKAEYLKYFGELNNFSQKVAVASGTRDKAFWNIASAYICFMQDKFTTAKMYLDIAGGQKMIPSERDVHDVIDILCIAHQGSRLTPELEADLLPRLKWVESRGNNIRFKNTYKDLLATILTDMYLNQQDTVRALYCLARSIRGDQYAESVSHDFTDLPGGILENMSMSKLHEVQDFVTSKNKTPFERWLTEGTPYPIGVLLELEGTKDIREMKFEKAAIILGKKDAAQSEDLPDVLICELQDSRDWDMNDSAHIYTKLKYARKMVALERQMKKEPHNALPCYQYANALYNTSYYGKANNACAYAHSTTDEKAYYTTERKNIQLYEREYYGVLQAMKYYMLAFNRSTDKEMKARCLFMAAKCWQKNCQGNDYYQNSLKSPYLARLNKEYKHTKLYQEAYNSCSYLRDYALFH